MFDIHMNRIRRIQCEVIVASKYTLLHVALGQYLPQTFFACFAVKSSSLKILFVVTTSNCPEQLLYTFNEEYLGAFRL